MVELAQVTALLVETAPLDDEIAGVTQIADDSWVVRFEDVDIEVGLDHERNRMILVTTIGAPTAERRLAVLEALLAYNFLLRETGGVRLAMTGTDGDVVQMVDVGVEGLTPSALAIVLGNMAEKTVVWRAFLAAEVGDAAAVPNPPNEVIMFRI